MGNQMKNGDMPAMPLTATKSDRLHDADSLADDYFKQFRPATGMTKREIIAMHAMQGLCADCSGYTRFEHLARDAVSYADALLAALEKTK